ncbi:DUF3182 family protein [Dyella sp.]|uniref:DUF3182 family protein n=1 Tax=Dyella sp. TaxID=1869338 RepID=UPI002D79905A|nr:DUF3182 family protein [Dyella sp.]HET6433099.1 DUF3182 family protein [Dyella sp.]
MSLDPSLRRRSMVSAGRFFDHRVAAQASDPVTRAAIADRRASAPNGRLLYLGDPTDAPDDHRRVTHQRLAERIAGMCGMEAVDERTTAAQWQGPMPYLVPYDTLDPAAAGRWQLNTVEQFFGGVVPHRFVATKAVVHRRVSADAPVPEGWSDRFASAVKDLVLPGYSAFDSRHAVAAARQLLRRSGPVRVKAASGCGGRGQSVLRSSEELARCAMLFDHTALRTHGVVLEPELDEARTVSIGQVHLGGIRVSYCGVQRSVTLASGEQAYAGSDLYCVRGGLDVLRSLPLPGQTRLALEQARHFHLAVLAHFPGTLISRANYDVIQGRDARGQLRSGVLEQSWRIGGASGAEIEAARLLLENPRRRCVAARTVERYDDRRAPADAWVLYRQPDAVDTPRLKFVQVLGDVPGW